MRKAHAARFKRASLCGSQATRAKWSIRVGPVINRRCETTIMPIIARRGLILIPLAGGMSLLRAMARAPQSWGTRWSHASSQTANRARTSKIRAAVRGDVPGIRKLHEPTGWGAKVLDDFLLLLEDDCTLNWQVYDAALKSCRFAF